MSSRPEDRIRRWRDSLARRIGDERADELEDHLRTCVEALCASGLDEEVAFRRARRALGTEDRLVDEFAAVASRPAPAHDPGAGPSGDGAHEGPPPGGPATGPSRSLPGRLAAGLVDDVLLAFRLLRRDRAFATLATLALAFGIGSAVAIFSVAGSILWSPLPYEDPHELVVLRNAPTSLTLGRPGPDDLFDWADRMPSLEQLVVYQPYGGAVNLTGDGAEPDRAHVFEVSPEILEFLGVTPRLGRGFRPEELVPGNNRVAIVSAALWRGRYGSDAEILGRTIRLNGHEYTVVGVAPDGFAFPDRADVWVPIALEGPWLVGGARILRVAGRLAEGTTIGRARAEAAAFSESLAADFEGTSLARRSVEVVSLRHQLVGGVSDTLVALAGAVTLLLLLTCANIANFALAHAVRREAEFSLRSALGGSRWRLARQSLIESLLLSAAGGLGGWGLAMWAVRLFAARAPVDLPRAEELGVDAAVFGLALSTALVVTVLFGIWPALASARADLTATLRSSGAGDGRRRTPFRGGLVVAQVALALLILAGSGLLVRSYLNARAVDTGFDPEGTLTFSLTLSTAAYPDVEARRSFWSELSRRLEGLPGVVAVGSSNFLPLADATSFGLYYALDRPVDNERRVVGTYNVVGGDFARAIGMRPLAGRLIGSGEAIEGPRVAVVNERMARELLDDAGQSGAEPAEVVGRSLFSMGEDEPFEIVGVVAAIHSFGQELDATGQAYLPYAQEPLRQKYGVVRLRSGEAPLDFLPALREQVRAVDPDLPIDNVATMEERLADSLAQRRTTLWLLGAFAAAALCLAFLGIHGTAANWVERRTAEIGVRIAVGASSAEIHRTFLTASVKLAALGIGVGLVAGYWSRSVVASLLFGIEPIDPPTLGVVVMGLMALTVAAVLVPARRAARLDPVTALRR